jgi:hypothetical protein
MISFAIWFQNTPLCAATRDSSYAYPIILTLHVTFISLFGAMILATDLRLLGWGFRKHTVSDIVDQLRWPKRIGFLLVATCGVLVLGTKAEEYFLNPFFRLKVILLMLVAVHALVFRGSVYSKAAAFDALPEPPARAKLAGALSLFLWVSIACAGRSIGYVYPPPGSHHFTSMLLPVLLPLRIYTGL